MATFSISSSLKIPKVSSEYAPNAHTESWGHICPVWNGQDNYGRVVSYHTTDVLKGSCHDPMARIAIENFQRPNYHPYLNVPGLEQDFINVDAQKYGSSFGGYDTLGTKRDESFGMYKDLEVQKDRFPSCDPRHVEQDHAHSVDRNARLYQRVHESNRYRNFSGTY